MSDDERAEGLRRVAELQRIDVTVSEVEKVLRYRCKTDNEVLVTLGIVVEDVLGKNPTLVSLWIAKLEQVLTADQHD